MDLQEKEMLEEALETSRENNKLIKKIWRDVKMRRITKAVYWIIIIGLALGAYYYVQPILEGFGASFSNAKDTFTTGIENFQKINEMIPELLK